jgi:hypothetical protein
MDELMAQLQEYAREHRPPWDESSMPGDPIT